MSDPGPRVYVISVPFGGGHRAVAEAIASGLSAEDVDIQVIDGLEVISNRLPLATIGAWLYSVLMKRPIRPIYRWLFALVNRWPVATGRLCSLLFVRRARTWLGEVEPNVVVSTFPFVTAVLGDAIADRRATRLVSVVTDGGHVNRSWFTGSADMYIVSDDDARMVGESVLAGPERVVQMALPLRSGFVDILARDEARAALGLDDSCAILVCGGGQGMVRGMVKVAAETSRFPDAITPIFVTGDNRRLARRLLRYTSRSGGFVFEQHADVAGLMAAADVVIGKAGWVSLTEASMVGLHTICIDALPGQEQENLRVSVTQGCASWEPDVPCAIRMARRLQPRPRGSSARADCTPLMHAVLGSTFEGLVHEHR